MANSNQTVTKKKGAGKGNLSRAARAAQTRERILRSALALFSRSGYDGVSVDEVVKRARINKRMVYHYFGDKDGLYAAALARVYGQLTAVEADIFRDQPSAAEAIERVVTAYFRFLEDTPEFVNLLLWENLQGGRHLAALDAEVTKAPVLEALQQIIDRGIDSGEIRPDLDRRHMLINLIGLCLVYFSNRHTLSRTVGIDLSRPEELQRGLRQAVSLAQHGFLQASPPPDLRKSLRTRGV